MAEFPVVKHEPAVGHEMDLKYESYIDLSPQHIAPCAPPPGRLLHINEGMNLSALPGIACGSIFAPQRPDCVAGHVRLELRNVGTNYAFEKSRRFRGIKAILATEIIRL